MSSVRLYEEYVRKTGDRIGLFEILANKFPIESVLYPGSYLHITPSFFFPLTVYIEISKKAKEFITSRDLLELVNKKKRYEEKPIIRFYNTDYRKQIDEPEENFDLLISQYAGFVSKYCKRYLKLDGLLLVNNTHGDASMAYLDKQFNLNGVIYKSNKKFYLTQKNLDKYFIPKKNIKITEEYLEKHKRGIGYKKTASHYLFKRIK